jgi:hypothetical protein
MQRSSIWISLGFCWILSSSLVFSQEQPVVTPPPPPSGGGAGTGGPGGVGNAGPGTTPGIGNNRPQLPFPGQDQQRRNPDFDQMGNRPIFLSGRVMMEDGGAPPETVTIERLCLGRGTGMPIPEGYTDSKGRFSFQVGQRMGMMPDASMGNDTMSGSNTGMGMPGMNGRSSVTERDLMSCELRASLPGYRSTVVTLSGRRSLDNPDVGTIVLRRLTDVTGFTTSATSLMAPKDAKKAFEKALNAMKKNKLPDAQREFETATNLHPRYAEAWFELGRLREVQKDRDGALASYQKALAADEKFVSPYLAIAGLEASQNKWPEVKTLTEKVIQLNRYDFPLAYFYGAVANYNLRDNESAEKLCKAGIEADQFHRIPKMAHLLGMLLADKQDYSAASEQLKAYLKFAPKAADVETVKKQLADIEGRVAASTPK